MKCEKKFISLGAFGEVRKALHKKSNMYRAIKIMSKSNTSKEEQEKMINEIEILKVLVRKLLKSIIIMLLN